MITTLLIARGADVNAKDDIGMTPLYTATFMSHQITIELIDRGADVNAKDQNGLTPLYYAVRGLRTEIESLLISRGAERMSYLALSNALKSQMLRARSQSVLAEMRIWVDKNRSASAAASIRRCTCRYRLSSCIR